MIYNATILRIDPPAPEPAGPDVAVRCALTPLSATQANTSADSGWGATLVAYVPLSRVPFPRPVADGQLLTRADGDAADVVYTIKHVLHRHSRTLGHIQLYLAPA